MDGLVHPEDAWERMAFEVLCMFPWVDFAVIEAITNEIIFKECII